VAPAVAAHLILQPEIVINVSLAFLSFGLMASAAYLINDILDIGSDLDHPTKRFRPIARGEISIGSALFGSIVLFLSSLGLGWLVSQDFVSALLIYAVLTSCYSFWLKRVLLVDVVTLSVLYTLRFVAGGLAIGVQVSSWLLAFSFFLFLSLSFVKRSSEILLHSKSERPKSHTRAYEVRDLTIVNSLGTASGLVSVLVFALYLDSETAESLYLSYQALWLAVPVLTFWISWVWMKAGRGEVDHDPVLFALKDRASLISGFLLLSTFVVAQMDFS
jgi:4-hydroxybenzoate polyprenyltransferase